METKQIRRDPSRRIPLYLRVLAALIIGNSIGFAAYLYLRRAPEPTTTTVNFTSTPSGARVSEAGVELGVTPFSRIFPRVAEGPGRRFEFVLAGHQPSEVEAFLNQEHLYVSTSLSKIAPPQQPPQPPPQQPQQVAQQPVAMTEAVVKQEPQPMPAQRVSVQPQPSRVAARRVRHRDVPRVADPDRDVPKITEEENAIPKLSEEDRRVPKLEEDHRVQKLEDDRRVQKLDDDRRVQKLDDDRRVQKLDDDRRVPRLDEEEPKKSGRRVPRM